jgi:hypothetical protein
VREFIESLAAAGTRFADSSDRHGAKRPGVRKVTRATAKESDVFMSISGAVNRSTHDGGELLPQLRDENGPGSPPVRTELAWVVSLLAVGALLVCAALQRSGRVGLGAHGGVVLRTSLARLSWSTVSVVQALAMGFATRFGVRQVQTKTGFGRDGRQWGQPEGATERGLMQRQRKCAREVGEELSEGDFRRAPAALRPRGATRPRTREPARSSDERPHVGAKAAGREGPNLTGSSRGGIVVVERRAWAVFEPLQGPECAVAGLTGARPPGRRRSQCASNSSA